MSSEDELNQQKSEKNPIDWPSDQSTWWPQRSSLEADGGARQLELGAVVAAAATAQPDGALKQTNASGLESSRRAEASELGANARAHSSAGTWKSSKGDKREA